MRPRCICHWIVQRTNKDQRYKVQAACSSGIKLTNKSILHNVKQNIRITERVYTTDSYIKTKTILIFSLFSKYFFKFATFDLREICEYLIYETSYVDHIRGE